MRKFSFPGLIGVLIALTVPAQAQQVAKVFRIGYLTGQSQASSASGSNIDAFRQGLREFRYIEGKNIVIEYRGAGGKLDRMPELAAELVSLGVDVIVTTGMPAVLAAKDTTSTIPIVTANADNLIEAGVIASLARPGGNVTGSNRVDPDFSAKRLELRKSKKAAPMLLLSLPVALLRSIEPSCWSLRSRTGCRPSVRRFSG
jgi:putative ABC transport system substrate-binding protein